MTTQDIEGFRLSPQQKRIWLLQQDASALAFRVQCCLRIEGRLDVAVLRSALNGLVARHEILRTGFRCLPGLTIPLQVIGEPGPVTIVEHDLSATAASTQEEAIDALLAEERAWPFDFEQGPLLRLVLVTHAPQTHSVLVTLPALCADAASLRNIAREIASAVTASGPAEPAEPMQYADLSEWENTTLEGEDSRAGRAFWRTLELSGIGDSGLPFETTPAGGQRFEPRTVRVRVEPRVAASLATWTAREHALPADALLACWAVQLWRFSGRSDAMLGVASDCRAYDGLPEAVGPFARFLPVRCRLNAGDPFSAVVQRLGDAVREATEWQDFFSWEHVAGAGQAESRSLSVGFSFEERIERLSAGGLSIAMDRSYASIDRFGVRLSCAQEPDGLFAEWHYDPARFAREDIERFANQFLTLLDCVLQEPAALIDQVNFLSHDERHRVLVEFNDTGTGVADDRPIHRLIEEQVRRTPQSIAIQWRGGSLTYAELNVRANRLAGHLRRMGVGPDTPVAICAERSPEMLVGVLGILKAGGAYVPLDPGYPRERLAFVLEDTATPVLVTITRLLAQMPEHGARTLCLDALDDALDEDLATDSDHDSEDDLSPDHLAYVIYTSGSTGRPKGVLVTHRNLVHSTTARLRYYPGQVTRFLLLSSYAFDSSVAGIFWTLCQGGALVLPDEGSERDAGIVAALIQTHRISHMLCLPSLYQLILATANPQALESLETVIVAGEACSPRLIERHHEHPSGAVLYNEYGPTEGTVWTTVQKLDRGSARVPVPIGRPIAGTQVYLLNEGGEPQPVGLTGELYIGGGGVTRGYLNRPESTAERFVADPFTAQSARLYRTGDLARHQGDGTIEFLGRVDHQVKIRGFRIELEEIELALTQHPAISQIVVVARDDEAGDKRLVAYLVSPHQPVPTVTELRRFLQDKLPEYMTPSVFVFLADLPVMPNGKVDRLALPEPNQLRPELEQSYVAPRTALEHVIAERWKEILQVERVGIHDSFFELGGNSIQAAMLVNRLRGDLGDCIHVATLFERPRVAELSGFLAEHHPEVLARLSHAQQAPPDSPRIDRTLSAEERALSGLADLTDAEVRAMLGDLLDGEGTEPA